MKNRFTFSWAMLQVSILSRGYSVSSQTHSRLKLPFCQTRRQVISTSKFCEFTVKRTPKKSVCRLRATHQRQLERNSSLIGHSKLLTMPTFDIFHFKLFGGFSFSDCIVYGVITRQWQPRQRQGPSSQP